MNNLDFHKIKINEYLNELEQIKNFKSSAYNRRKLQLKLMIKRHKKIVKRAFFIQIYTSINKHKKEGLKWNLKRYFYYFYSYTQ